MIDEHGWLSGEYDASDDTIVWRYMKFSRFIEILETHKFWFSRPFCFDDSWEGRHPPSYYRSSQEYLSANGLKKDEYELEARKRLLRHRYAHFINCWQMGDHESDGMWRLYGSPRGIAIQSTVGDLKNCLRPYHGGGAIYYSPETNVRSKSIFGPPDVLFKRKEYSWEREYRIWFDDDPMLDQIEDGHEIVEAELDQGKAFGITEMQKLFRKIVICPGSTVDFLNEVKDACTQHNKGWIAELIQTSESDKDWQSFAK